ncbi:MAG TPA: S8 family serine peptidase [Thermoanaerobaculia bacterium]|nr:S8 family serine peptidase [Thermoanaerobaculia bacterium]
MRVIRYVLLAVLAFPAFAGEKYIVEYRAGAVAPQLDDDAPRLRVKRHFSRLFRGAAIELAEGQSIGEVARLPYVARVHVDAPVFALEVGPGPAQHLPMQGAFETTDARGPRQNAHRAVSTTSNGSGVVVAVLDTGIDHTHPALAGKVIGGWDFVNDDAEAMDDHRHGTHVAGIIAAQSSTVTGVATGVSLLAYKVLGADGRGDTSDIIAALERMLDPNNDGDLSDRADVANLSLGNRVGHPGDPLARAVESAIAAGVVVCVAAGNEGVSHAVASPGVAPSAITVGASDLDDDGAVAVAHLTSRGPAAQSGDIKPDLIAPGMRILSTGLEHGYIALSGTSMATPYVAGLAALLLEQHPHWTPARIKAALVTTATPIPAEEVMGQGTGAATYARAAANDMVAAPTQLNFGLNGALASTWTATRRFTIRNEGTTIRVITAQLSGTTNAIALSVTPNELTLTPGAVGELEAVITVDNTLLPKPPRGSLSFGGFVTLQWSGDAVRVPWAFVRATRATISYAGAFPQFAWSTDDRRYASFQQLSPDTIEALLEPATYDFFVAAANEGDVRLIVREDVRAEGDVRLALSAADAPHAVRLDAYGDAPEKMRSTFVRLLLPRGGSLLLPTPSGNTLHASTFSERVGLLATQGFVDTAAGTIHIAQFPSLRALASDRTLSILQSDYASQELAIRFPTDAVRREITIMPRDWPRRVVEVGTMPPVAKLQASGSEWRGTLYMTAEVHPDYAGGVQLASSTERDTPGLLGMNTPVIRRNANGFFASRGFDPSAISRYAVAGETMTFGGSATHLLARLTANAQGLFGDPDLVGTRDELRRRERMVTPYTVFDENNQQVTSGVLGYGGFMAQLNRSGKFRAELKPPQLELNGRAVAATLTTSFDTTHGAAYVPALTSLAIVDGVGRHITHLPRNGNGALIFSAAAHNGAEYRRVVADRTKVFFRRRGTMTWVQLSVVEIGEDANAVESHGRGPAGVIFRGDLADVLRLPEGEIELSITIANEQGNLATWDLSPAFVTGAPIATPKRRSVR